ncbi:TonB-dependent receptor plug domain-containing protein, partial [Xylophilus sp.]|uniref:TonB-dependent receptor plug domain-containing protein n=1 Tax=Xylophilus sp. TaxID=2653893 RepID=UPI002D80782B
MKFVRTPTVTAVSVLMTLLSAQAQAQDDAGSGGSLKPVTVSAGRNQLQLDESNSAGTRLGLSAWETTATVQSVSQDEMQARGLRTAKEVFADIPGAVSGNVPGNPATLMMRGFSGNAVSILQDGVRISTSTVVQRDTNTWHFERIEVIKGPASVLHGEGALGGVINKVTRKPTFDGNHVDALLSAGLSVFLCVRRLVNWFLAVDLSGPCQAAGGPPGWPMDPWLSPS